VARRRGARVVARTARNSGKKGEMKKGARKCARSTLGLVRMAFGVWLEPMSPLNWTPWASPKNTQRETRKSQPSRAGKREDRTAGAGQWRGAAPAPRPRLKTRWAPGQTEGRRRRNFGRFNESSQSNIDPLGLGLPS
jgi:hypothetical protein